MRHSTQVLRLLAALPLGLAATLLPLPVHADSPSAVDARAGREAKREIQASYDRLCHAYMAKERRAVLRWMERETTPDYEEKTYSMGSMTRRQELEDIKKQPWDPSLEMTIRIIELKLQGDEATVLTTNLDRERSRDARLTDDSTGRPHELTMQITARDTWLKTAAGWKMKRHETLTARRTVDGQPRPVPGTPPLQGKDERGPKPASEPR
jgi:hypothetical protein